MKLHLNTKNNFLLWEWLNIGTGCSKKLGTVQIQRSSQPYWTPSWATCSRCPCLSKVSGMIGMTTGSPFFNSSVILWMHCFWTSTKQYISSQWTRELLDRSDACCVLWSNSSFSSREQNQQCVPHTHTHIYIHIYDCISELKSSVEMSASHLGLWQKPKYFLWFYAVRWIRFWEGGKLKRQCKEQYITHWRSLGQRIEWLSERLSSKIVAKRTLDVPSVWELNSTQAAGRTHYYLPFLMKERWYYFLQIQIGCVQVVYSEGLSNQCARPCW